MSVVRALFLPFLAGLLASTLTAPLSTAPRAESGFDATGQLFLRFNFGGQPRDAGPRFGLRLGTQPTQTGRPDSEPQSDFTSAIAFSFDGQGRGALSFADLDMAVTGAEPLAQPGQAEPADILGYAPRRSLPLTQAPLRRNEPAPLVTAAGPAPRTQSGLAGETEADRWSFRRLQSNPPTADKRVMGPRFRGLAATLLHDHQNSVPAKTAPTMIAAIAATGPAERWQFHAIKTPRPAAHAPTAGYAALLLAPHGRDARPAVALAQPLRLIPARQTAQPADPSRLNQAAEKQAQQLVVGQWVFHDVTGEAEG